jgi:hypothetical protein
VIAREHCLGPINGPREEKLENPLPPQPMVQPFSRDTIEGNSDEVEIEA